MNASLKENQAGIAAVLVTAAGIWLGYPNGILTCPLLALFYPAGLAFLGTFAAGWRTALFWGFAAGLPGHVAALYWIALPLSQVGGLPLIASAPLAVLVAGLLATQCALFALACHKLWHHCSIASSLALGLIWYLLEYAYAAGIGFPWLPLSGALTVWPVLVQISDTTGAFLCSGLWAAAALLAAGAALARKPAPMLAGLALAAALSGYGFFTLKACPLEASPADSRSFPVLFVEGNIDQNQKWNAAYQKSTVDTYTGLSEAACASYRKEHPGEDLSRGVIIWPETAMPFDITRSRFSERIQTCVITCGMPLVTGAPVSELSRSGENVYNRAQLISASGYPAGHYDKEHLVPFGEYVPGFLKWEFLAGLLQEVGAYAPGRNSGPMKTDNLTMGTLICYEGIFPWLAQTRTEQGADVLLDISNDGWFGTTPAALQHLYLTALRSLEQNRWLIRGTNTGISAVIDPRGRLAFRGGQFQAQALWARARTLNEKSFYHFISPFIPPAAAVIAGLLLWWHYRKPKYHASAE